MDITLVRNLYILFKHESVIFFANPVFSFLGTRYIRHLVRKFGLTCFSLTISLNAVAKLLSVVCSFFSQQLAIPSTPAAYQLLDKFSATPRFSSVVFGHSILQISTVLSYSRCIQGAVNCRDESCSQMSFQYSQFLVCLAHC